MPSPSNRATQRFCSKAACRAASKARSDRRWRQKNPGYDRGPEHVERMRQWRAKHPGYSKGRKRSKPVRALQDFAIGQVLGKEALAVDLPALASTFSVGGADRSGPDSCSALALQDFAPMQNALVVGLIATLMGVASQESIMPVVRQIVERGRRVLVQHPVGGGLHGAPSTINPPSHAYQTTH